MSGLIGTLRGFGSAGKESGKETLSYYSKSGRDERRLVKASFFMGVVAAVYWYIIILYLNALEFGSVEIGLIFGLGTVAGVVSLLLTGFLADKFGRRNLLLLGLVVDMIGLALFLSEKNLIVFIAASVVANFGGSIIQPALMTLLAGKTTTSKVKVLYGLQGFSNQLGLTFAALAGMYLPGVLPLDESTGYWYIIAAGAAFAIVPIALVFLTSDARGGGTEVPTFRGILRGFDSRIRRILIMFSLQNALIGLGAGLLVPWFPLIFQDGMGASNTQLALMFALSNIAVAFGWFIVPKFAEFRGSVVLVAVCQLASIGFMVAIPYSPYLAGAAILYMIRNVLMLIPIPVLNAYVINIAPENIRASFFALSQVSWMVPFAIAESMSGFLWADDYSKVGPFFACAGLYILATLIFYFYFRGIQEPSDLTTPPRQSVKMA
jgi:MFS family permease